MEVFILLVLSIGLCQATAVYDILDSHDPEVVDAVARAIKALNDDRSHGNKFAPGVILRVYGIVVLTVRHPESCIRDGRPYRFIKYINETATALIALETAQLTLTLVSPNSLPPFHKNAKLAKKIVAQSRGICAGCWHHMHTLSRKVRHIVRHTIRQYNNQSQHISLFGFPVMKEAENQVVNGMNYRFKYFIKETNCSKNEFADLSPECRPLPGGLKAFCKAKAYADNRAKLVSAQVECRLEGEDNMRSLAQVCPGCHGPIAADSQKLKKPLEAVVKLFNLKNSSDFYFKIVEITKISGQMLVGHVYRIDFKAQRTNCSKSEVEKPDDNCTAVKGGELMTCHALIYVKPWEPSVVPEVTCTDDQPFQATELAESQNSEDYFVVVTEDYGNYH